MSIGQSLDSIVLLRCAWQELQKMSGCSWISHHYSENFIQRCNSIMPVRYLGILKKTHENTVITYTVGRLKSKCRQLLQLLFHNFLKNMYSLQTHINHAAINKSRHHSFREVLQSWKLCNSC